MFEKTATKIIDRAISMPWLTIIPLMPENAKCIRAEIKE
jgi:hypothetical protein